MQKRMLFKSFYFFKIICKRNKTPRISFLKVCLTLYILISRLQLIIIKFQKKSQKYVLLIQVGINKKLRIGQLVLSQNEQVDGNQGSISPTLYMQLLHMQIPKE